MKFFLIGMMGSGKSAVGKLLAKDLNLPILDIDNIIEKKENLSIKNIFHQKGEHYFRLIENETLRENKNPSVISCGGGIILEKKNRKFLEKSGYIIYLKASVSILKNRLMYKNDRPLIDNNDLQKSLEKIYNERKSLYNSVANMSINTDKLSTKDVCKLIIEKIKIEKIYS